MVEKKFRCAFHASADVVENARPREAQKFAEVVEKLEPPPPPVQVPAPTMPLTSVPKHERLEYCEPESLKVFPKMRWVIALEGDVVATNCSRRLIFCACACPGKAKKTDKITPKMKQRVLRDRRVNWSMYPPMLPQSCSQYITHVFRVNKCNAQSPLHSIQGCGMVEIYDY